MYLAIPDIRFLTNEDSSGEIARSQEKKESSTRHAFLRFIFHRFSPFHLTCFCSICPSLRLSERDSTACPDPEPGLNSAAVSKKRGQVTVLGPSSKNCLKIGVHSMAQLRRFSCYLVVSNSLEI